ncbi:MAG: tRNA (5-methylaminomethyl-2-thiouridine)(34)-methyltransferase MnmD [Paracoccaceae bacterium]
MGHQQAELEWRDAQVPVSIRFDDPYYSLENGLAETRHVFLGGNDLPARLRDGFAVAELGFGTGLNTLALASVWTGAGRVRLTSFEAYPLAAEDMAHALAPFSEVAPMAVQLVNAWAEGARSFALGALDVEIIEGDARETLPTWEYAADAWFLDGFSPAKNPELWSPELMLAVGAHTKPGGSAATYTAAGSVRRGLERAGFAVERVPGFGRKRHMTRARMIA